MKSARQLGVLVCILGQVLISAAMPQNRAGTNPIVTISTGQLRGSLTANGGAAFKNMTFEEARARFRI
jgi:hypothetical protein